jgi:hypothetical protein
MVILAFSQILYPFTFNLILIFYSIYNICRNLFNIVIRNTPFVTFKPINTIIIGVIQGILNSRMKVEGIIG